jgi:hypothetical protein
MRKIMSFGIAALLVAVVAGAWLVSHTSRAGTPVTSTNASVIDPIEMMKTIKDLPVHSILDAI